MEESKRIPELKNTSESEIFFDKFKIAAGQNIITSNENKICQELNYICLRINIHKNFLSLYKVSQKNGPVVLLKQQATGLFFLDTLYKIFTDKNPSSYRAFCAVLYPCHLLKKFLYLLFLLHLEVYTLLLV